MMIDLCREARTDLDEEDLGLPGSMKRVNLYCIPYLGAKNLLAENVESFGPVSA